MTDEATKVGILVVHGIGEQKKFGTVEEIVRDMATTLKADPNLQVRIIINEQNTGAYGADEQTWQADDREPIIIEVKNNDEVTELRFSEVWWADLGDPESLETQVSFWCWGLSLWSRKQFVDPKLGTSDRVKQPYKINEKTSKEENPPLDFWGRLRFFWVSLVILLVLPVLSFLSIILRKILGFNGLRPDILVQYLGDIKFYQEGERKGKGPLMDLGHRPRISIRRRMIKGLVEMSLRNYDRWYVLSHSLGTIVAFNGLMETEEALPNYLNEELWNKWNNTYIEDKTGKKTLIVRKKATQEQELTPEKAEKMRPSRPAWLNEKDIIARSELFEKLQGFVTYGSPLSKFGVVWPGIVPINRNNTVFNDKFEWLNVYDPTDPVAGKSTLFNFTTDNGNKQQPQEIAYKADGIHLLSHVEYLTFNPSRTSPFVKQLAKWILDSEGNPFQPGAPSLGWPQPFVIKVYQKIRILIWIVAAVLISWVLGFFVRFALPESIEAILRDIPYLDLANPLTYIVLAIVIVFIVGTVNWAFKWNVSN
ncbi:MAG: hypothetical protein QNJ64_11085 [Crocosphaera sp.]|nr:hypothetical protein [Crocosphaera sp.]